MIHPTSHKLHKISKARGGAILDRFAMVQLVVVGSSVFTFLLFLVLFNSGSTIRNDLTTYTSASTFHKSISAEFEYIRVDLGRVGNALMEYLDADAKQMNCPCFNKSLSCKDICNVNKKQCLQCHFFGADITTDFANLPSNQREKRNLKKLFDLPFLESIENLALMMLHSDVSGLKNRFNSSSELFTKQMESRMLRMRTGSNATFGGGGGMGFQIYCDGALRLSIGGGAGFGFSPPFSFGGGTGAGFQLYDTTGKVQILNMGGGIGGGLSNGTITSGKSLDEDNQVLYLGSQLSSMRRELRACWRANKLMVLGGGGSGGGLSVGDVSYGFSSAFRFSSEAGRCQLTCNRTRVPSYNKSKCDMEILSNKTKDCVHVCKNQLYEDCLCMCYRNSFNSSGCDWSHSMSCTG